MFSFVLFAANEGMVSEEYNRMKIDFILNHEVGNEACNDDMEIDYTSFEEIAYGNMEGLLDSEAYLLMLAQGRYGEEEKLCHRPFRGLEFPDEILILIAENLDSSDEVRSFAWALADQRNIFLDLFWDLKDKEKKAFWDDKFLKDFGIVGSQTIRKTLQNAAKGASCEEEYSHKIYLKMQAMVLKKNKEHLLQHKQGRDKRGENIDRFYFEGMELSRYDLSRTILHDANLKSTKWFEANLSRARIYKCDISQALFCKANLSSSTFIGCNFKGANLANSILTSCVFRECSFAGCILFAARINGSEMTDCDFSGADLTAFSLKKASVSNCQFNDAFYVFTDNEGKQYKIILNSQGQRKRCELIEPLPIL